MDDNTPDTNSNKRRRSVQKGASDQGISHNRTDYTSNFHVSIAWNLVEPDPEWLTLVQSIDVADYAGPTMTSFDAVKAKIGNAVNNIDLSNRNSSLKMREGLLG